MCGRYALFATPEELARVFKLRLDEVQRVFTPRPRYNVAPSETVLAVRRRANGREREAVGLRWGLIPHWAKGPEFGARTINARAETADRKPAFRDSFRVRRCLIPASGFYEWKKLPRGKQPYFFRLARAMPLAFAGMWDRWVAPSGDVVESCTIITTRPNSLTKLVHDRMPAIVDPEDQDRWLESAPQDKSQLAGILRPYPASRMAGYPVSSAVNKPGNEMPDLIEPIGEVLDLPAELDLGEET